MDLIPNTNHINNIFSREPGTVAGGGKTSDFLTYALKR